MREVKMTRPGQAMFALTDENDVEAAVVPARVAP